MSPACQCDKIYESIEERFCNCLVAFKGTIVDKEDVHVPPLSDVAMLNQESSSVFELPDGVEILTPPPVLSDFEVHYKVNVKHIYKDTEGRLKKWMKMKLLTSKDPQNCGKPELLKHGTYLFQLFSYSGQITFCDGFDVFDNIPPGVVDWLNPNNPICEAETMSQSDQEDTTTNDIINIYRI